MKHIVTVILLIQYICCIAQETIPFEKAYKRSYHITKILGDKPVIDGKLNEPLWEEQGNWTEDFVQVAPYERVVTTTPTKAKLLYDDKYIYIGIIAYDTHPETINRFIGNRDDNSIGDLISIAFDTYHNFAAAPEFNINAGGNKTDLVVTDKLSVNLNWNAVWECRTHVSLVDSCWTAEFRVPFSQLRYNQEKSENLWGLHIRRIIRRNGEIQNWSLIPLKNNGHVFSFGEMYGIDSLPKSKNIEFLPYMMGKLKKDPTQQVGPYGKKNNWGGNVGLDAKFGLSDYTMDVTINPDYGQVEQDPSVMNLTAYEIFYDEKRPFFLEGKHILDYTLGNDMMFYTRRIGASPSFQPQGINGITDFAERRDVVPIIGALKLTGTSNHGLTLGIVQSLTAKTSAKVTRNGKESEEVVEPLTNYTVARVQKNWKGNTWIGGMLTSVNRFMDEDYLKDYLVANALTGGIDFTQYFNNRLYYVDFKGMFSMVEGTSAAISRRQLDPVHYYQRASAQDYLGVNLDKNTLSGTGGYLKIGRKGNAQWNFSESFNWLTPGFDLNDVGYLREADIMFNDTEIAFRQTNMWKMFRSNNITFNQINKWTFDGRPVENNISLISKTMFINRYQFDFSESYIFNKVDTRMLRGGPDIRIDPFFSTAISANTNRWQRIMFSLAYKGEHNTNGYSSLNSLTPGLTFRVGNHIHFSGNFNYQWNKNTLQYVGQAIDQVDAPHYLMGTMDQRTYGLTLRAQINVTPDISLQYYGSPFTSTASYNDFKRNAETMSHDYNKRFYQFAPNEISLTDNIFSVSENGNNYSFSSPDFSFNEFRSNLVLRWEYLPGSTLYLVWEHRASSRDNLHVPGWNDNLDRMFGLPAINTLMFKINYWFGF